MTVVTEETTEPQFAHVMRGYDRAQVDDYVQRLYDWAQEAVARADYAEAKADELAELVRSLRQQLQDLDVERRTTSQEALTDAADRSASALAVALQEAGEIRQRTSDEADSLLAEARSQAMEIVDAARRATVGLGEACAHERRKTQSQVDALMEEASQRVADARQEAAVEKARLLLESEAEAKRLVEEAEEESAEVHEQTQQEIAAAMEVLSKLRSEREQIVDELGRLRGAIQKLIDDPPIEAITHPAELD